MRHFCNEQLPGQVSTLGQMGGVCLPNLTFLCPKYQLGKSVFTPTHSCGAFIWLCQRGFPKEMAKEDSRFEDFPKDQSLKAGSCAQGVQVAQDAQDSQCIQGAQSAQDAQSVQKAAGGLWPDEPHGLPNTPSLWGGWCGAGRCLPRTSNPWGAGLP